MKLSAISFSRGRALRGGLAYAATIAASSKAGAATPNAPAVSAETALKRLREGNRRFVAGNMRNQGEIAERRLALAGGQTPFATILACSDSRTSPELLFDQHIGDLFVVRNAGNFVTDAVLGTIEYGTTVLGSRLVLVLGHDSCGAVSATYDALKNRAPLPPHLDAIEQGLRGAVAPIVRAGGTKDSASAANAREQALRLSRSSVLRKAIADGGVVVVAAKYQLATGRVEMLSE